MSTLQIERVRGRYHLPRHGEGPERLERTLREALDTPLEEALGHAGLGRDEIVCIRSVHVPLRTRLGITDAALRASWAGAIAAAVARAYETGEAVRYGSISHALCDVVLSVAGGNVERAWAWRQLSLWPRTDPTADADRRAAAAAALLADPTSIVPVLVELARSPARARRFLASLPTRLLETLARSAAVAAGAPTDLLDDPAPEWPEPASRDTSPPAIEPAPAGRRAEVPAGSAAPVRGGDRLALERAAEAVVGHSVLANLALPELTEPAAVRALALLAILENESARLAGAPPEAAALVAAVARRVRGEAGTTATDPAPPPPARQPNPARNSAVAVDRADTSSPQTAHLPSAPPPPPVSTRTAPRESGGPAGANAPDRPPAADRADAGVSSPAEEAPPRTLAGTGEVADAAGAAPPLVRRDGETEIAGLVFLLNLVGELEIPERILADDRLRDRPLRWSLQRIALRLLPVEPTDAAVLAFCGLRPGDPSPAEGAAPQSTAEAGAIAALASTLLGALAGRLGLESRPAEALRLTAHRSGRVVADPGWIEVRLSLRDVSLELRRAGLDRNPDHVPWLGVVVRFVYE